MQVTVRRLLAQIERLRETAFTQPPHWDHEPTAEERKNERDYVERGQRDFKKLEKAVHELQEALLSPFVD